MAEQFSLVKYYNLPIYIYIYIYIHSILTSPVTIVRQGSS